MSMNVLDYVILAVIAAILSLAIFYIIRAKKRGAKCIGCPNGASCSGKCAGCSGHCGGCNFQK